MRLNSIVKSGATSLSRLCVLHCLGKTLFISRLKLLKFTKVRMYGSDLECHRFQKQIKRKNYKDKVCISFLN